METYSENAKFRVKADLALFEAIQEDGRLSEEKIAQKTATSATTVHYAMERIKKRDFFDIGGYDEDMTGVAYDDNDIVERLKKFGCRYQKVDSRIIHVFHERLPYLDQTIKRKVAYNRKIYMQRKKIVRRNLNRNWGESF